MNEEFRIKVRRLIKAGEGSIAHMYLDKVGKVTVGVGNMLPSATRAAELPFLLEATKETATSAQVEDEFDYVSEQDPGRSASFYKQFTTLVLAEVEIDRLLDARLDEFEKGLQGNFTGYENLPEAARLGLMDMAFNLGINGLVNKFPSFTAAVKSGDWETCARECQRKQIQDSRNEEVREMFLSCGIQEP